MSYCLPSDVRLALASDGDPSDLSSAASLDDVTIQAACDEASSEIDARVSGRYTVPFQPDPISGTIPPLVLAIARDVAAYLATLTFRKGQPMLPTDPVLLRYTRAQMMLTQIQTGAATIQQPSDDGQEPSSTTATVVNQYVGNLFQMEEFGLSSGQNGTGRFFPPYPR